jgi:hypothetical protein
LPAGLVYVDVAAGWEHNVARRSDGSAVAWGRNDYGQCNVPALPSGLTYVEVTASYGFSAAVRSDGSVVAWGENETGQCDVPALPAGLSYMEVRAEQTQAVARRSDGSVIGWGNGGVPAPALPVGLTYVDVQAGGYFAVARRSDGTAVAWGSLYSPGVPPSLPAGVSYSSIAAGFGHALARCSDGIAIGWGWNDYGQSNIPPPPPGFAYADLSGGTYHSLARLAPLPACGGISHYCWPAAPNTVSTTGATFSIDGCPSLTANNLVFTVTGLPHSGVGIFYYGSVQKHLPFGAGWRCGGRSMQRVGPPLISDLSGVVTYPVHLSQSLIYRGSNAITPGSAWNFQYWYRDPPASVTTFNLSDAWNVVFAP